MKGMIRPSFLCLSVLLLNVSAFSQIDRSKPPLPGPNPKLNIGNYETFELENGLKVFVVSNHKIPRLSFQLRLKIDPVSEKELTGYVEMAGQLMRHGTTSRTKTQCPHRLISSSPLTLGDDINYPVDGS